jgi:hypothetical protein
MEILKVFILIYIAFAVNCIIHNQVEDYQEYKNFGIKCKEARDEQG